MSQTTYSREELVASGGYKIGDTTAPPGFDPDAKAFAQAPLGDHVMTVDTYDIEPQYQYTVKDVGVVILDQLRPRLEIMEGPHQGASILDFIPLPTDGAAMPAFLANRFANFVRALGFQIPAGRIAPAGFDLDDIMGRRALVSIVQQLDGQKQPKISRNGEPMHGVKLFGYSPVPGTPQQQPSQPTPPATTTTIEAPLRLPPKPRPQQAAAPATAGMDFDL
jgi:hypothetical protein